MSERDPENVAEALVVVPHYRLVRDDDDRNSSGARRRLILALRWHPLLDQAPQFPDAINEEIGRGRSCLRTLEDGEVVNLRQLVAAVHYCKFGVEHYTKMVEAAESEPVPFNEALLPEWRKAVEELSAVRDDLEAFCTEQAAL